MTIRAQIRELLTAEPRTAAELAEALKMEKARAHNNVAQLVRAGRIRACGSRNNAYIYATADWPDTIRRGRPKGSTRK